MEKLKNIFYNYISTKSDKQIKQVDKLCVKLDVDVNKFWKFYLKHISEFNGSEMLTSILTYFHWFLDEHATEIFKTVGITFDTFWFEAEDDKILVFHEHGSAEEFDKKVNHIDLSVKRKLLNDKVMLYLFKKSGIDILNEKEKRQLKLEKLNV